MLADWSRLVRWALILVIGFFTLARPMYGKLAWAGGDDDDDDDSASAGDDDDDGGGDDAGDDDDADQPPVTAGGLYTKATYPVAELQRPLTITGGMSELRFGANIDASNSHAFKAVGLALDARHGVSDNVELLLHVSADPHFLGWEPKHDLDFYAGFEGSLSYDLVDFRVGAEIPITTDAGTRFRIPFGFPFRYAFKPQIGIVALESFMTIDFDSVPDFTPALAIVGQPIPALAVKLHAAADVANFDFSNTAAVGIPVDLTIQFSPSNLLDIGGEFAFPNVRADKFYNARTLLLFLQLRV